MGTKDDFYTAIIPVRAGSRRIKNKNIVPFAGSNLLVHKIRQLQAVPSIDAIVVSSDSDEMLKMANDEGAHTHKRGPEYCVEGEGQEKTFGEVVRHICENIEGEHVVWSQCTSPLLISGQYEDAIDTYRTNLGDFDSLATVEPFQRHVWSDDGPVNYERGKNHVLSQELPMWYFVTGVFIAPREKMIEWNHNIGMNPYKYCLPKESCVDIDDEWDLELARTWHDRVCDCLTKEK